MKCEIGFIELSPVAKAKYEIENQAWNLRANGDDGRYIRMRLKSITYFICDNDILNYVGNINRAENTIINDL
jgi:hypothetical protein